MVYDAYVLTYAEKSFKEVVDELIEAQDDVGSLENKVTELAEEIDLLQDQLQQFEEH